MKDLRLGMIVLAAVFAVGSLAGCAAGIGRGQSEQLPLEQDERLLEEDGRPSETELPELGKKTAGKEKRDGTDPERAEEEPSADEEGPSLPDSGRKDPGKGKKKGTETGPSQKNGKTERNAGRAAEGSPQEKGRLPGSEKKEEQAGSLSGNSEAAPEPEADADG